MSNEARKPTVGKTEMDFVTKLVVTRGQILALHTSDVPHVFSLLRPADSTWRALVEGDLDNTEPLGSDNTERG